MDSKFTPGPWEVGDDGISTPYAGDRIHVETGENCREADARLIAAAPDLYTVCKAVLERSGGRLYDTDQETGETFDTLIRNALARVDQA